MEPVSGNRVTDAINSGVAGLVRFPLMGRRLLVLGALVAALAVSAGLLTLDRAGDVVAQDSVMLYEATITVGTYPEYDVFDGYSNVPGGVGVYDELVFGAIDQPSFEHEGTQYKVLGLYLNNHFDVMYLMIDPLFQLIATQRPP